MLNSSNGRSVCARCRIPNDCPFASVPDARTDVRGVAEWRYYGRNCTVFRQHQDVTGLLIVHTGWLTLYSEGKNGKRIPLGIAGPGTVFGLGPSMEGTGYVFTAETGEETEIEFIPVDDFRRFADSHPSLGWGLLKAMARQARLLTNQMADAAGRIPADERLWNALLDLSRSSGLPAGSCVKVQISVQDLSAQIGCSRQWTTRLLNELEEQARIERTGGWIIIDADQATRDKNSISRKVLTGDWNRRSEPDRARRQRAFSQ